MTVLEVIGLGFILGWAGILLLVFAAWCWHLWWERRARRAELALLEQIVEQWKASAR